MKDKLLYKTPFVKVKVIDEEDVLTQSLEAGEDFFNPQWATGIFNEEEN